MWVALMILAAAPTDRELATDLYSIFLYSPESADTINARCSTGSGLGQIDCVFSQILLMAKEKPALTKEDIETAREPENRTKLIKHIRKVCREPVTRAPEALDEMRLAALTHNRTRRAKLCACKRFDCMINELADAPAQRKCIVMGSIYNASFKRTGDYRWVSTGEPAGDCQLILVMTLSFDPGSKEWSYTQQRVATQPPSELCPAGIYKTSTASTSTKYFGIRPRCDEITLIPGTP